MTRSRSLFVAALMPIAALVVGTTPTLSRQTPRLDHAARSARILYVAGSHLWVRAVDSGTVRQVTTPWSMKRAGGVTGGVRWAPDGRRVAVDDGSARLAIVNLVSGRRTVLLRRVCAGCSPPVYAWSPNSRYLAFVQVPLSGQRATLKSWDSATGKTRVLLSNASAITAFPEWSHHSDRIAVPAGSYNTIKNVYPTMMVVSLGGHSVRLGKGTDARWSPNDQLIGIIRPNTCGANTCDEDVVVAPSTGGKPVVLRRHSSSLFDDPIWSPRTRPYMFDRWQLDASGHPQHRLTGLHQIVLSWNPDGTRLLLQTYYPYQSIPDSLYIATRSGTRTRLYTDGRNQGCGACSKDVYTVAWGRTKLFAWTTPTYPTPGNVTVASKLFVSSLDGGPRVQVPLPKANLISILGFAGNDRDLVVQADKTVYAYRISTRHLTTLARGLSDPYSTALLEPAVTG